jgi:hypothetical protein
MTLNLTVVAFIILLPGTVTVAPGQPLSLVMGDCFVCTGTPLVITPNYDYDDKARSSPSFDTMMQSNVRGWRVNRFIKSVLRR